MHTDVIFFLSGHVSGPTYTNTDYFYFCRERKEIERHLFHVLEIEIDGPPQTSTTHAHTPHIAAPASRQATQVAYRGQAGRRSGRHTALHAYASVS